MACSMVDDNARELELAIIFFDSWQILGSKDFIVSTKVLMCELENRELPRISDEKEFSIADLHVTTQKNDIAYTRLYLRHCILKIFPRSLCTLRDQQNNFMLIWNLELTGNEIIGLIIKELLKNPFFTNENVKQGLREQNFCNELSRMFAATIITNPILIWGFKVSNRKSQFKLERIACNFVAKKCMDKIIDERTDDRYDYLLDDWEEGSDDLRRLYNSMSFINIMMFMDIDKIDEFNRKFYHLVENLELNCYVVRNLKSYCPRVKDFNP